MKVLPSAQPFSAHASSQLFHDIRAPLWRGGIIALGSEAREITLAYTAFNVSNAWTAILWIDVG